jgi:hypothetical protein
VTDKWIARGRSRGHAIVTSDGTTWVYEDDGAPYVDARPCAACGLKPLGIDPTTNGLGGPDGCLGYLPGVDFACCGHGIPEDEYVKAGGVHYASVREWTEATGKQS